MKSYSFKYTPWGIYLDPEETGEKNKIIKTGKSYQRKDKHTYFDNENFFRQTFMNKECGILILANNK